MHCTAHDDDTIFNRSEKLIFQPLKHFRELSTFDGSMLNNFIDDISDVSDADFMRKFTNLSKQLFVDHFSAILVTPQNFLSFGSPRIFPRSKTFDNRMNF